jgi:predicted amidohydrolase
MRTFTLAVIEARGNRDVAGLHTDPFVPEFRFDELMQSVDSWLAHGERLVEEAAGSDADLVLLSEDFTHAGLASTYLDDRSVFRRIAEHQAEVVPRRLAALAGRLGRYLAGSYFAAEGTLVRNVCDLFGPDGTCLGRYRKVHLPEYERWQVSAGDGFPVFETDLGRIGMLICYDQNRPEAFASLALGGAEIVLHPSAETIPEYRMLCRSVDHHVFYASACPRGSAIASPVATILARSKGKDPEVLPAELSAPLLAFGDERYYDALYSGIRAHRLRELRYRRPDTYGMLVEHEPPVLRTAAVPAAPSSDEVARIYEHHRSARIAAARGLEQAYHWDYWRGAPPPHAPGRLAARGSGR